ncbi:hypothetical protein [Fimbriiglobus ruber]|uniref:Mobile element protein n=1 Tax=Fimbriiglobus ruber TaxID=1908690 RepID=A0A225DBD5_9BACT|nr:hypothetical protein [Fimbriiglobus ruber]OWK34534.1 hypothetical protein FRUB_10505 [Fimbriiglobus ruber]OWK36974.1 hypothetical protein FRUB_07896 [Fimbriiglobus ruber]
MDGKHKDDWEPRPDDFGDSAGVEREARRAFDEVVRFCSASDSLFRAFEQNLLTRLFALGCLLTRLFLACRHERLEASPPPGFRRGAPRVQRTLKTLFGPVTFGRSQMIRLVAGASFYPLDATLGLTRDGFSPWVIQFVTRLATRMSFASSRLLCRSVLGWSPSVESIAEMVIGLGQMAEPFMKQQPAPANDGEVLVIEVDGKCPPTARADELAKRRGRRRKHAKACVCGCQRHRGQAKRKRRGGKKRRKKGDKSKNGKEVVVIVMYTLERGEDGRLHGPRNKKVWASFGQRRRAALWARAEATKRGFGPDTTKTVQIVVDGASGLRSNLAEAFPNAIVTVDICHVVEKLWELGHRFHQEGSDELKTLVEEWKELVYAGRAEELVTRLRGLLDGVPRNGPGTLAKRKGLGKVLGYIEPRLSMMKYAEWRERDLVIASGQVEGAVRHVVGERMDCAGMRWIPGRAEALLHLRCIEINGDWEEFIAFTDQQILHRLIEYEAVQIRSNKPLKCGFALAA